MSWITAILEIIKGFFSWRKEREENFDHRELEKLDEQATDLRNQIRAAAHAGNDQLLRELTTRFDANRVRAKTLRSSAINEGGEGD
jgi:phage shock protein A